MTVAMDGLSSSGWAWHWGGRRAFARLGLRFGEDTASSKVRGDQLARNALVGELRSPRLVSPNVEDVPNAEATFSRDAEHAQHPRHYGHEARVPVSSAPPRSGVMVDGRELTRDLARELQADNDELRESNLQLIAAMEEIQSLNVTLQSVNEALHTTNVELRTDLDQARMRVNDLEHMLNGIGVAAVLLSEKLEVREYNATAARFFTLNRQDIGRSIARVPHDFVQTSLPDLCRDALDHAEPFERIVTASSGDLVSLRIREVHLGTSTAGVPVTGASMAGVMLTVTEITDLGLEPQAHFA